MKPIPPGGVVPVMRLLLAIALIVSVGCVPAYHIDYIDFVKANGITYVGSGYVSTADEQVGRSLTDADLGPEQLRVRQRLAESGKAPDYRPIDGDAAFLAVDEPVYAVRGYAPTFRLAARRDGRLVLYEADTNPSAKIGRDLLDIEGKVRAIALISGRDGRTVLGRISDAARVRELVALILAAPVDQSPPPAPSPAATAAPGAATPTSTPFFIRSIPPSAVAFELTDGTATRRGYDATNGVLQRGIRVAGAFRDAFNELVAAAPTPTPVPATVNLTKRYDLARAIRVTIKAADRGLVENASVARFAAALDADLPARSAKQSPYTTPPVVIFEFPDRYVSLVYDKEVDLLLVASPPEEEYGVVPTAEFRQLLDATR